MTEIPSAAPRLDDDDPPDGCFFDSNGELHCPIYITEDADGREVISHHPPPTWRQWPRGALRDLAQEQVSAATRTSAAQGAGAGAQGS